MIKKQAKRKKQYPLKVVEHRPARAWVLSLGLLVLVAGGALGSYHYGRIQALKSQVTTEGEIGRLRQELAVTLAAEADLRQQLATLQLGAQVDRRAAEDVRQEVIDLKTQLAELQEENSFYRNLMAPSDNQEGLTFGAVELTDTDTPRRFRFKVVMQQLATNHQLLNGTLTFNVVGRRAGLVDVIPLNELSEDVDSANIKLRFKYFQTIQGQLQLPPDFEPERIELVAKSTGRNAATVEKRFGWLVQEI